MKSSKEDVTFDFSNLVSSIGRIIDKDDDSDVEEEEPFHPMTLALAEQIMEHLSYAKLALNNAVSMFTHAHKSAVVADDVFLLMTPQEWAAMSSPLERALGIRNGIRVLNSLMCKEMNKGVTAEEKAEKVRARILQMRPNPDTSNPATDLFTRMDPELTKLDGLTKLSDKQKVTYFLGSFTSSDEPTFKEVGKDVRKEYKACFTSSGQVRSGKDPSYSRVVTLLREHEDMVQYESPEPPARKSSGGGGGNENSGGNGSGGGGRRGDGANIHRTKKPDGDPKPKKKGGTAPSGPQDLSFTMNKDSKTRDETGGNQKNRRSKGESSPNRSSGSSGPCYRCGQRGHISSECKSPQAKRLEKLAARAHHVYLKRAKALEEHLAFEAECEAEEAKANVAAKRADGALSSESEEEEEDEGYDFDLIRIKAQATREANDLMEVLGKTGKARKRWISDFVDQSAVTL
jgi:uncharacterized membrane protein YgcG